MPHWFRDECVNQGAMMDNDILAFLYDVTDKSLLQVMFTVHIYSLEILSIHNDKMRIKNTW